MTSEFAFDADRSMLSAFSEIFCLLKVPIPTLKDGITIGDTIEVIVVALVVDIEVETAIDVFSGTSDVMLLIVRSLLFEDGWLSIVSLVDVIVFV